MLNSDFSVLIIVFTAGPGSIYLATSTWDLDHLMEAQRSSENEEGGEQGNVLLFFTDQKITDTLLITLNQSLSLSNFNIVRWSTIRFNQH